MSGGRLAMNFVVFQGAWLGAVGGAGAGLLWLGPVAALIAAGVHLALAERPLREFGAILAVTTLGTSWDVASATLGLIEYRGGIVPLGGAAIWIVALWVAFATTLNTSLAWLRARPLLTVALGAVVGPLCYVAAERLGAVVLALPTTSLAAQAVAWALLLPVCLRIAARLDGTAAVAVERVRV